MRCRCKFWLGARWGCHYNLFQSGRKGTEILQIIIWRRWFFLILRLENFILREISEIDMLEIDLNILQKKQEEFEFSKEIDRRLLEI